jgi:ribosome-associated protein
MQLPDEIKRQLENECVFSASRSSGPGGQNVNKVNTRVELRFSVTNSNIFTEEEKTRIFLKLGNRINSDGELLLTSDSERTQLGNKQMVIEKFFLMIEKALTIQRKRIKTRPTFSSKLKRLDGKKIASLKKQLRKPPDI